MNTQSSFSRIGKGIAIAATFGALCFFAGVPRAQADDRNSCQVRMERAESKLNDAIQDHGYYSHQANDRRRDLNNEQQRCWNQARHQDGYGNQWRNEHNWNRDDRNRDRDDRNWNRDRDDRNNDRDRGRDNDNRSQNRDYNRDFR